MNENEVLERLNSFIIPLEEELTAQYHSPKLPVVFIIGVPRSGTTLVAQWLINHYKVGYINNLIAKFWQAPMVGASLYKAIQPDFFASKVAYQSKIGFTKEIEGPHEFGYFWKRWFSYGDTHQLTMEDYKKINQQRLRQEIAALEAVFQHPVFFKNPAALSLHMDFLSKCLPTSLFIIVERDPHFNAQSLYQQRITQSGSPDQWFSVKPKEYQQLKNLGPHEQVAGQVYYTLKKIKEDIKLLDKHRHITVSYEAFCQTQAPLRNFLSLHNINIKSNKALNDVQFDNTNTVSIEPHLFKAIQSVWKSYS